MFSSGKSAVLRQGDITPKVYFTPPSFHSFRDGQLTLPQTCVLRCVHLVLMSQCCELQWFLDDKGYSRPRRPYVLVVPLSFKIPFATDSLKYRKLIENGENRPKDDPVQFFWFPKHPATGAESVVDLSTIMPVKTASLRDMFADKLLELDVKHRHLLRTRLRDYFSRIPEEEWTEVAQLFPEELG